MDTGVKQGMETLQTLIDTLPEFTVAYGFQILGPLVALAVVGAFGATVAIQDPLSNFGAGGHRRHQQRREAAGRRP